MSRFQEAIQALAMEEDADARLELAAQLDTDAGDLDDNWANRDAADAANAELASVREQLASAEGDRDVWKQRYADRFFEGSANKPGQPATPRATYDNIWD